ncbi:MAG: ComF family protein [Aeromonas sp.]
MWPALRTWFSQSSLRRDGLGACLLCQQPCQHQPLLCGFCLAALADARPRCPTCAALLPQASATACGHCQQVPPPWQRLQVIGDYQPPFSQLIPAFKYQRQILLAPVLAQLLYQALDLTDPPQAILPVPLHWWRHWQRGFNQSAELGRALTALSAITLDTQVLRRTRHTRQQTTLSQQARQHNLHQAFAARPCPYRHVALLDDVVTTGTTAGELTRALQAQGVEKVEVWALCRTQRPQQD